MPRDLQAIKKIGTIADNRRHIKVVIGRGCRGALYRLNPVGRNSTGRLEAPVPLRGKSECHLQTTAAALCRRASKPCNYRCTSKVRAHILGF